MDKKTLSPSRTQFALKLANGMSQRQAYKEAFNTDNTATADANGYKLAQLPQVQEVKEAAEIDIQEILKERAPEALETIYNLMLDNAVPANVRLQAARDYLDRAGHSSTHKVETTKKLEYNKAQFTPSEKDELKRLLDQV